MPRVHGQLLNAQERPMVGARVELWGLGLKNQIKPFGADKTAANGQFSIELNDRALAEAFHNVRNPQFEFRVHLGRDVLRIRRGSPVSAAPVPENVTLIVEHQPAEQEPEPEQFAVRGQVTWENGEAAPTLIVRAVDKDLRNEEPLGHSVTDQAGRYEIAYTRQQFSRAEKDGADLIVRAFNRAGSELGRSEITFNAPAEAIVNFKARREADRQLSEFEKLLTELSPLLENVALADLTDEDVTFLTREAGGEQRERIEFIRQGARLEQATYIEAAAFYGFFSKRLPLALAELLKLEEAALRQAIEAAIADNIVPSRLRDSLDSILRRLANLRMEYEHREEQKRISHTFTGQLLKGETAEALARYTIRGIDLEADAERRRDLGSDVTDGAGLFSLTYTTPPSPPAPPLAEDAQRRLRLHITTPFEQELAPIELQVRITQREIEKVRIVVPPPPAPPTATIATLIQNGHLNLPAEVSRFLAGRGIATLADVRKQGGLKKLGDLPRGIDKAALDRVDAHANLELVSSDARLNTALIAAKYMSIAQVAAESRARLVTRFGPEFGDFKVAHAQVVARAQAKALDNLIIALQAREANGFPPPE